MGSIRPVRPVRFLWLTVLAALVAACSSAPPPTPTVPPGGLPTVFIDSPANGSPTPVGQPLTVQARAEDGGSGVNRIDLRVGGILVDSEGTPGLVAQQSFSAALQYVPSADGAVTIAVTAYRPDGTASQPAEITVAVVLGGASIPPTASPSAGPTPTSAAVTPPPTPAGPTPTAAARPTLPPFATPTPSPSPTPSPTPTPLALDMRIELVPAEYPPAVPWTVGVEYTLHVNVYNDSAEVEAPPMDVRVRLCNTSGGCGSGDADVTISTSPLAPGTGLDYEVKLTPQIAGERQLRAVIRLPNGYADPNAANNSQRPTITVDAAP